MWGSIIFNARWDVRSMGSYARSAFPRETAERRLSVEARTDADSRVDLRTDQ